MGRLGVRAQLVALVVLVMVPLVSLLGLQASVYVNEYMTSQLRANEEFAEAIGMAFQRYLDSLWATELAMGLAIVSEQRQMDPEQTGQFMAEQLPAHTAVVRFIWLSPEGVPLASTDRRALEHSFEGKEYVARIQRGAEVSVSSLLRSKVTGQPVVSVARGIRVNGELRGIQVAVLDVTRLGQILPVTRGERRSYGLVDENGMVVYHSTDPDAPMDQRFIGNLALAADALHGSVATVEHLVFRGTELMGAAAPIPRLGWAAYATNPLEKVTAAAARHVAPYVIVAVLADLFTVWLLLWLGHRQLRPILALQRAAAAISQGDLSSRVNPTGSNEIAQAARTFDQMAERIQQSEEQLRARARQQGAVAMLGLSALEGADLSAMMDQALSLLREVLNVELCYVMELQPGGETLLLRAGLGWSEGLVGQAAVPATGQSQAGFTLQAREPVIVSDLDREDRFPAPALLREHGAVSGMSVIIHREHSPYGVLGVYAASHRTFTQDDLHFLQAVANVVATAVQRVDAQRGLAVQYQVARALAEASGMREGLGRLLQVVCEGLDWEMGAFWLPDSEGRTLRCEALWRHPSFPAPHFEAETRAAEIPIGRGIPGVVFQRGQELFWQIGDQPEMATGRGQGAVLDGIRCVCAFPVMADGVSGVLELISPRHREADPTMADLMRVVGGQVAQFVERKRAEEELRQVNAALEQRVAERTAELASANRELEAFSYSVSHDLQGPLRSIAGFAEALEEDGADRLTSTDYEHIRRIQAAARRMNQLIKDILRLSQVARQEIHRREVNLSAMAGDLAAELERQNPNRVTQIRIQPGLRAFADGGLLRVALFNLLSNACNFTSQRPDPIIEVGQTEVNGETAFFVRDNGIGFDMAQADHLFLPFRRLHRDAAYPGSGVGLATVQRVIHRHGGRIWAESQEGQGAAFYFTLGSGVGL